MGHRFAAVYRDGVIVPLEPVEWAENQKLTVLADADEGEDGEADPADAYPAFARAVQAEIDAPGMELYDDYDAHRAGK